VWLDAHSLLGMFAEGDADNGGIVVVAVFLSVGAFFCLHGRVWTRAPGGCGARVAPGVRGITVSA
jgi:hypothetical protein